jgi:hypothetical protein
MGFILRSLCYLLSIFPLLASAEQIAQVLVSVGGNHVLRAGQQVNLQRAMPVEAGDELNTGAGARLVVKFNDGTVLTLGENTQLLLNDWQFKAKAQDNHAGFKLGAGVFRMITGAITQQQNPDLNIETPIGSIGVRGTDFWGGYLDADAIDVILLEGEHKVEVSNALGSVLIATPGYGVTMKKGTAPAQPVKWGSQKLQRAVQTISLPE